jgi:hypothetical protein
VNWSHHHHIATAVQGPIHEYDVIGHPRANFHFSVVFPFHSAPSGRWRDGEVTLIKEFCQGTNAMAYCLPTGAFDPRRHADNAACALAELSEEVNHGSGASIALSDRRAPAGWCRAGPEARWAQTPLATLPPCCYRRHT